MIQFKEVLITPQIAENYLSAHTKNRRLRTLVVQRYAQEMKAKRWKRATGETIKIDKSGYVIDGQHRLNAVIMSKTPTYFHVSIGHEEDVFQYLDTGMTRNATDIFKIEGIPNENIIPSIIGVYNLLKAGKRGDVYGKKHKGTNAVVLKQYYESPEFWQNVARVAGGGYRNFNKVLSPSLIGGFYALFHEIDEEKAMEFIRQLTTGYNIENRTLNSLRNRLINDKISIKKMNLSHRMALIIKTWNFYNLGKEVNNVAFYESRGEKFPKIYGLDNF